MVQSAFDEEVERSTGVLVAAVKPSKCSVAIAESLTGGQLAAMAASVVDLLGADFSVAVTGAGGPEPADGEPPGTVFLATFQTGRAPAVTRYDFEGEPIKVIEQTMCAALDALVERIKAARA